MFAEQALSGCPGAARLPDRSFSDGVVELDLCPESLLTEVLRAAHNCDGSLLALRLPPAPPVPVSKSSRSRQRYVRNRGVYKIMVQIIVVLN